MTVRARMQRTTILSEEEEDSTHEDVEIIEVDVDNNIKKTTIPEKAEESPKEELSKCVVTVNFKTNQSQNKRQRFGTHLLMHSITPHQIFKPRMIVDPMSSNAIQ